jgi:plasmid maintenance system antidote protein VapI
MNDKPLHIQSEISVPTFESTPKQPVYNPDNLLKTLLERLGLKSNVALCRVLDITPPLINKIRRGKSEVSAPLLIRMHDISGMSIKELRQLMGDRRRKFRISEYNFKPNEDMAIAMRRH